MMHLVKNEQTKLLANALNTAATSSFTVGVLAPGAAAFYAVTAASVSLGTVMIGATLWIFAAVSLHLAGRFVLKGLRDV